MMMMSDHSKLTLSETSHTLICTPPPHSRMRTSWYIFHMYLYLINPFNARWKKALPVPPKLGLKGFVKLL